ncbi:MAG: class I SAM-dependent methyltransferase [Thermaerobacter sp.]|nr:class I SAM-dependent methyltransferase [Thermaerobacter sp.]
MVFAFVVIAVLGAAFAGFRIHGKLRPQPMAMSLERFFLGNPVRLRFFGPRQALALLGSVNGATVAEVGTGIGIMVSALADRVGATGQVHGVDIQADAVRRTRRRVRRLGLEDRVSISQASADRLPWATGQMDRVVMVAVLGEIAPGQRVPALAEIRRVLAPGGIFLLTEFWPDPHYLKADAVRRLLRDAGLRAVATKNFPLLYTMAVVASQDAARHATTPVTMV